MQRAAGHFFGQMNSVVKIEQGRDNKLWVLKKCFSGKALKEKDLETAEYCGNKEFGKGQR